MAAKRLTQIALEKLRHDPDRRVEVPDGKGLYLVLQPSGSKSWAFRYRRPTDGRPAKLTLGPVRILRDGEAEPGSAPAVGEPLTLAQARRLAGQVQHGVAVNEDPAAERKAAKVAAQEAVDRDLFEVIAQRFLERYARPNTRASTFGETVSLLGFRMDAAGSLTVRTTDRARDPRWAETWPAVRWRGRKLQSITRRDVNELLDAIVDADAPHAANSTLSAIRRLFNWSVEQDVLPISPCVGVRKRVATVERDRVLSDEELRLVWLAAGEMEWPFGHLVKLLALTGARRDEWAEAKWSEVDLKGRVFHLPRERSKNGLAHDIPLSPQAVEVLEDLAKHALKGTPDWLFSTGKGRRAAASLRPISGFSRAKRRIDATILGIQAPEATGEEAATMAAWRLHDLRRTAVTGMARLGVALPVAEKAINHVSGTFAGVVRVYQRHDYSAEVREALDRWGAAVERVNKGLPAVPSNVVPLRA
jgi:integrase